MYNPFEDPTASRILRAFSHPHDLWRTPGGIARETGLPFHTVQLYLRDHPDLFRLSPLVPGGTPLYSLHPDVRSKLLRGLTDKLV